DRGLAVVEWIPRKSNPGLEVMECGVLDEENIAQAGRQSGWQTVDGRRKGLSNCGHIGNQAAIFGRNRGHLVTQSEVESETRAEAPVVLNVSAENFVAQMMKGKKVKVYRLKRT